jgi:hypothetical protein
MTPRPNTPFAVKCPQLCKRLMGNLVCGSNRGCTYSCALNALDYSAGLPPQIIYTRRDTERFDSHSPGINGLQGWMVRISFDEVRELVRKKLGLLGDRLTQLQTTKPKICQKQQLRRGETGRPRQGKSKADVEGEGVQVDWSQVKKNFTRLSGLAIYAAANAQQVRLSRQNGSNRYWCAGAMSPAVH